MTAPVISPHLPAADPAAPTPARGPDRGGPWPVMPPTYDRGDDGQAAFERAVARLWEHDSWPNPLTGQRELNADLVLEGGGVKGIGLAAAILVLAEAGYRFPRAAGTSAGAIAAVLVAAIEKSGQEMTVLRDYLSDIDYQQFMPAGPLRRALGRVGGRFADACELMFRPGRYSGGYLRTWLGGKLALCGVETWADLAISLSDDPGMSLPECQRYRAVVHVSDISRGTLARLPWDYEDFYGPAPDARDVVAAVRASMSIPFFYGSDVTWPGGIVTWVDGGMLLNFPIGAFDRVDGAEPRWPTIGIRLSAEPGRQQAGVPTDTTLRQGVRSLRTMMGEWDQYHVGQATANRTIFVANAGLTATQFDLRTDQQNTLFRNGAEAATRFLIRCADAGGVPRSA